MSQTSHFPKLVSFFAKYTPSEIQILPEILFCHVEIVFMQLYRSYGTKSKNLRNKLLTQNWYNSKLPNLIFTAFCLNYLNNALNKKPKKMTGHLVNSRSTDN